MRGVRCVVALLLLGCVDQDPFGLSERRVAGPYRLKQWEDGATYYLVGGPQPEEGGGAIDGTVRRLGWDRRYILLEREANVGGVIGWMVIDAERRTVAGPYTEAEARRRPGVATLATVRADSAWAKL